jgi:hypothetical protein
MGRRSLLASPAIDRLEQQAEEARVAGAHAGENGSCWVTFASTLCRMSDCCDRLVCRIFCLCACVCALHAPAGSSSDTCHLMCNHW